jgi:lipoprotein-anchoring transpeptidase ErfK/SrfK
MVDARKLMEQDQFPEAKARAEQALNGAPSEDVRAAARELLGQIDVALVLSERPMTEKIDYTVQPGDTLGKLASRYGSTIDLIAKGNNVSGQNIRAGDRMRIFTGKFSVKVDKSDNILDLYMNDRFFKRYRVGTGQYSKTPTGTFKITDRIAQPTWYRDDGKVIPFGDPENLLGTHWLALDVRGYGIHGTWEPGTIGKQASAGCVRLLNEDVEQLYTLLPVGTPVTIED